MNNPYKKQAKIVRDIIWAVDNDLALEPNDVETLEFVANTLDTLAKDWSDSEIDRTMQKEVDQADESYRADLMDFYGDF